MCAVCCVAVFVERAARPIGAVTRSLRLCQCPVQHSPASVERRCLVSAAPVRAPCVRYPTTTTTQKEQHNTPHMFIHTHCSQLRVQTSVLSHLCTAVESRLGVKGGGLRSRPALSGQRAPRTVLTSKNLRSPAWVKGSGITLAPSSLRAEGTSGGG